MHRNEDGKINFKEFISYFIIFNQAITKNQFTFISEY